MKRIVLIVFMTMASSTLWAQKFSVSTNLLEYASLCTFNVEGSYAVSRRWNILAGARYNPFTFREGNPDRQFQYRQQSYHIGAKVWPWHTWTGWWFATKMRYQEYNCGGFFSDRTQEGDRAGVGLYVGYAHMLSKFINIEFGLGVWGGVDWFRKYSCPVCGLTLEQGTGTFILPDDVSISIVYVF